MGKYSLQKGYYRACANLKRNSATILTCVSAVGVISTAVMTARAAPKAALLIEEERKKKGEDLTMLETASIVIPVYTPAIFMGAATISCIFGANILNKKQQNALTSAYTVLSNYHKEYQEKLKELYGEEADIRIRHEMVREYCNQHLIDYDVPDGKVIFYDEISGESVVRYEREVIDAEYHFNRNFVLRGYASLNDFYEFLGMPKTDYGDVVGWSSSDGYEWIDFEHRLVSRDDGGQDIYTIDMIFPPEEGFMRDWE